MASIFRSTSFFDMPKIEPFKINVFAAGQLFVKAGSYFEQRRHAPVHPYRAGGRIGNARENFQQRALARSIPPDDADHSRRVRPRRKRRARPTDIFFPRLIAVNHRPHQVGQPFAQHGFLIGMADAILFRQPLYGDRRPMR